MSMTTSLTGTGWKVDIDAVNPQWVAVPPTAASPGIRGQMALDASYAYFCIAANTWVRVAVSSW
jgi:hypothetical protein